MIGSPGVDDPTLRLDQEQALERLHRSVTLSTTSGTAVTTDFPHIKQLALREVGIATGRDCRCVAVRERLAYVGIANGGIAVVDLANPAQPQVIGGVQNPKCTPSAITIVGSTMYVADQTAGVFALDLTNPRKPKVASVQSALAPQNTRRVLVSGKTLVLVGDHTFATYDVAWPRDPKPLAIHHRSRSGVGFFRGAALVGTQLYLTQGVLGLWTFDLSDPAKPVARVGLAATLDSRPNEKVLAETLAIYDGRAFVGTSSGVWVLRLAPDADPESEAFFTGPGTVRDAQGEARNGQLYLGVFESHDHAFFLFDVVAGTPRYLGRQRFSRSIDKLYGYGFAPDCTIAVAGNQGLLVTGV
jgi:hypothetical protein